MGRERHTQTVLDLLPAEVRQQDPINAADPAVMDKLAALARRGSPRVLDLFSGCGGISAGFHRAGYTIAGNVEMDADAALSHALNFHGDDPDELKRHSVARDITILEPADLAAALDLGDVETAVDVIVGGPPCQAYARVGRAKLSHIADDPHAFKRDERRNLYLRYLHYVAAYRPLALLLENVPDILNQDGHNVVEEMVATLADMEYDARYTLVNAASYGVPQTRDRVFMLAFRRELRARIRFPEATHHVDLPHGYTGSRSHALKLVSQVVGGAYLPCNLGGAGLTGVVTARDAIGDLPALLGRSARRGPRRLNGEISIPYSGPAHSDYARTMRGWPGFEAPKMLRDHVIRALPRDCPIFARMPQGAEYPHAHAIATRMFEAAVTRRGLHPRSKAYAELWNEMVPPYDPGKFSNKWWKLKEDAPVRTLMAHMGRDSYSHIHYDRLQARTISVREAARLQSFPDGWRFAGTMNPAFQQIGNAVPPLLAAAIAGTMREILQEAMSLALPLPPLVAEAA